MSKYELIDDYLAQRISRRMFIQGLTALGVSSGIAASYAVALQPASAATCNFYDDPNNFYDLYDLYCDTPGSGPDGGQGNPGPTDDGQSEDGDKKRKRRRRKGKKKKK